MTAMRITRSAPLVGLLLALACGGNGDERPAASADSSPGPAAATRDCPDPAEISRVLGATVAPLRSAVGCQYVSDDQSYDAGLIFGAAALGSKLMGEVREEAQGRRLATEAPGFGDEGVLWATLGNAAGVVVGNGKTAYAAVTMGEKDRSATKAALLTLLRQGIE